jgi:MoCo/4Fe-4S cofactor protein with predicted Tat translocation signal
MKDIWRSLEELHGEAKFEELLHREFPLAASAWDRSLSRRKFLQVMAASFALAGLSSCVKQPDEKIVPYVNSPELVVPGETLSFATAVPMDGVGMGVLVTSTMGRPIKIEGNPDHPASLGSTDMFMQASILGLYDPDRSQVIVNQGTFRTWSDFLQAIQMPLQAEKAIKGAGLRILTGRVTSPTLGSQLDELLKEFPEARWHHYQPVNDDNALEGARLAFGEAFDTIYRFDKADVVVSLDQDFFAGNAANVRYGHDFAEKRRVRKGQTSMNRLYVAESTPTITGAMADHRLAAKAGSIAQIAGALARALGLEVAGSFSVEKDARVNAWVSAAARNLEAHKGRGIVIPGRHQAPVVHALTHAMNERLENSGVTVSMIDPIEFRPADHANSLRELVGDLQAGKVSLLVIIGGNPVYDAPADIDFKGSLAHVEMIVRLGTYEDETSAVSHWHIPETHHLETWGDIRAYDGTVSIMQPLIAPLYDGISAHQLLEQLMGRTKKKAHDIVSGYWKGKHTGLDFERFWETALNNGVVAGTAFEPKHPALRISARALAIPEQEEGGLEINYRPDPTIGDGTFSNNAWLQELAKPLTKLTWDNAALVSPALATRLAVSNGDVVTLECRGRTVDAPVWILPAQPDEAVTLHLGYGRTRAGRVGTGVGVAANALRRSGAQWFDGPLSIRKTGRQYTLATTQEHFVMEGRDLIRAGTISKFISDPSFAHEKESAPTQAQSLYPPHEYKGYSWGMSIDLNVCTGCSACVVACQAENNIPVVGKEQVALSREMQWIRIDRYYKGDLDDPETLFQPVPCMHCENAPCELVCPVGATMHDSEGLNVMVYNRCVGTRYCSNNCPYKVRRFNFLEYNGDTSPTVKMEKNPDVTVRSRGVMEKCTYCLQRISHARINAEKEGRTIRDGEFKTACEAACPTQAIVFGNMNDHASRVSVAKAEPHDYSLLGELNTKPHTTYLAKLTNPNPELNAGPDHHRDS